MKLKIDLSFDRRGVNQIIVISLMIVFVIAAGILIFSFFSGTIGEEGEKSGDRAVATEICRGEVKIRINDVRDAGGNYVINLENLKQRNLNDFLIRYESGRDVEIKKARQILGGYENANIPVEKPGFIPGVVKIIPQIVLEDELSTASQGWWLCSNQVAIWNF